MVNKRGVIFLLVAVFLVFSFSSVLALGISPAFKEYNFDPGYEEEIHYTVLAPDGMDIEISAGGDLAEYVTLSKTEMKGSGKFSAKLKMAESVEVPGAHRIRIFVGQKVDPELASGFIGTRVVVVSTIDIYVPYPGRYLETSLKAHDVNVNEPVNFELDIISQGKEDVTIKPRIDIFSQSGEQVDSLYFNERVIRSQENVKLQKLLNTSKLNAGNYRAVSVVDYGSIVQSEAEFRIGDLVVNILGHSTELYAGKLQKFDIGIASGWNNIIDGAYADVVFSNSSGRATSFKTSTTTLLPWQETNITGYVDTTELSPGQYNANITLIYFGREQGSSTSKLVQVNILEPPSLLIWFIIGGAGIFIILILVLIRWLYKNGKKRKK